MSAVRTFRILLAGAVALAVGFSADLHATPAAAKTATVTPTAVAVIPPDDPTTSARDAIIYAGATGFAHHRQGRAGVVWTDYATGATHPVPQLTTDMWVRRAGGDTYAVLDETANTVTIGTPDSTTTHSYPVPAGYYVHGLGHEGTRVLFGKYPMGTDPADLQLRELDADGGTIPITGLPDGALIDMRVVGDDSGTHALVGYHADQDSPEKYVLLDLDTGATTPVPGLSGPIGRYFLTQQDLVWISGDEDTVVVNMLPESAILDGSAATMTPATVTLPNDAGYMMEPAGNHLILVRSSLSQTGFDGLPVQDYPFGGGSPTTLMASNAGLPVLAADGAVLEIGGADATSSAVHRYIPTADGGLADHPVLDLPPVQARNVGLSLTHGMLRHIQNVPRLDGQPQLSLFNHGIAPDSDPYGKPYGPVAGGTLPKTTVRCESGHECVRTVDGGDMGTAFLSTESGQTTVHVRYNGHDFPTATLPTTDARLVDASHRLLLVDGGSAGQQYLLDSVQMTVVSTGPVTGAALWNDTLWRASTSDAGTVTATEPQGGPDAPVRTISTGTACRPTELQVSQHWLYWSCGVDGPAGVYDLSTGTRIAVPSGRALLGDGYLLRHVDDQLVLVDFHSGTASAAQPFAHLAASSLNDDRGITWTVDRYGGDVAYVDDDRTTHVVSTGVPPSGLSAPAYGETAAWPRSGGSSLGDWDPALMVDSPVDDWQVTISNTITGNTVFTEAGGPTRGRLRPRWDARLPDGSLAPSGAYHWQLRATVDGETSPVAGASGRLDVVCGAIVFRSYNCVGQQALLAVKSTGAAHWWHARGGTLHDNGYSETWHLGTGDSQVSALVPFGDFNGDGYGDLLVRHGDGVLTAYLGVGRADFGASGIKRDRIGGGYNAYNVILAIGDLNDDGRTDLVARDKSGAMWFKAGTGHSGLGARVKIAPNWTVYKKLVAPGDITGDGCADILAEDGQGRLWRYNGNKHGAFGHRTQIANDWRLYNRIIGIGDLNQDGRNDLVTRDGSGNLWRYDGTPSGTFPHRHKIGTGWGKYAGLY